MLGMRKSQMTEQQTTELCTEAFNIFSAIIAVFSAHTKSIYHSTVALFKEARHFGSQLCFHL